jgi:hypothetical protein
MKPLHDYLAIQARCPMLRCARRQVRGSGHRDAATQASRTTEVDDG